MAIDYVPPQPVASDPTQRHSAPAAYPYAAPDRRLPKPAPVVARRSKAEALHLAQRVKRGISVSALLGFGMCSIVVGHQLSTAHVATAATSTSAPNSATQTPSDGGFFTQQPGGSGVGNSGSQAPVTGSNVS